MELFSILMIIFESWCFCYQTLLINGRGQFNCSLAAHFINSSATPCKLRGNEQYAPSILKVQPNKTYRLRIASSTALASLNLAIGVQIFILISSPHKLIVQNITRYICLKSDLNSLIKIWYETWPWNRNLQKKKKKIKKYIYYFKIVYTYYMSV